MYQVCKINPKNDVSASDSQGLATFSNLNLTRL